MTSAMLPDWELTAAAVSSAPTAKAHAREAMAVAMRLVPALLVHLMLMVGALHYVQKMATVRRDAMAAAARLPTLQAHLALPAPSRQQR